MEGSLRDREVLFVDCQTTGAAPDKGEAIELAWCRASAADVETGEELDVFSSPVALPEEVTLPRRIAAITGITAAELAQAPPPGEVYLRLEELLGDLAAAGSTPLVVAHFARFERAFLLDMHARLATGAFPGRFLCTHELARRLVPDLPRLGLHALAGYFGHPLPEKRRAADHVIGTARIWAALLTEMDGRPEGRRLADLERFLETPPPRRPTRKRFPMPAERRRSLPPRPGIYRFLDRRGEPLYIGKATNLRTRVASYFQATRGKADHILTMVTQAFDVTHEETATRLEAALLETDGIKEHDPPYNRALRAAEEHCFFFSSDLSSRGTRADARHPLGPFPRPEPLVSIAALHRFLASRDSRAVEEIPVHGPGPPSPDLAREAATLFLEAFPGTDRSPARLIALGAVLARRAADRREESRPDEGDEAEELAPFEMDEEDEMRRWSGPRLARAFCHLAAGAGRLWLRAVWTRLIGESTLSWRPGTGEPRRQLVVSGAEIVARGALEPGAAPEGPPGWERTHAERGADIDRTAYDRLRVLTAEIRRVARSGRAPRLDLGPHISLEGERLRRLLEEA
jgi:DNA polymerase III epsilon subunit-like protein